MVPLIPLILILLLVSPALADVYRYVAEDGSESYSDAPVNGEAVLIFKEAKPGRSAAGKKSRKKLPTSATLQEIVERTVNANQNDAQHAAGNTFDLPVQGVISSPVGIRHDPIDGELRHHNGIDIAIPEGTPVKPVAPGKILYSGVNGGYGNMVVIEHADGMVTTYAHNSRILMAVGDVVTKDSTIALSGSTGRSTGPHLHFEAWQGGRNVTPVFMPAFAGRKTIASSHGAPMTRETIQKFILSDGSILFTNLPKQ